MCKHTYFNMIAKSSEIVKFLELIIVSKNSELCPEYKK